MRNLTATICLAVALLLGSAGVSWSQDFQKGLAAAQVVTSQLLCGNGHLLPKQGNADAQYNLGVMYDKDKVFPGL